MFWFDAYQLSPAASHIALQYQSNPDHQLKIKRIIMKRSLQTPLHTIRTIGFIIFGVSVFNTVHSQTTYQTAGPAKITIEGTSNIHDWVMSTDKGNSTAVFITDGNGAINGLSSLTFSLPVESLKSESSSMDKNAYKAMHTAKYASLTFTVLSASLKPAGNNNYQVQSKGRLTISGVSRDIDITALCTVNPDKSIAVNGSYKLKMTAYSVTPPSIMLGAIKTGDDITVKFNLLFKTR
jgi:polyisoprenoid-binding protein YceI